jgi:hypothetical protein
LSIANQIIERINSVLPHVELDVIFQVDRARISYRKFWEIWREKVKAGTTRCPYHGYVQASFVKMTVSETAPIKDLIIDPYFLQSFKEDLVSKIKEEFRGEIP